MARKTRTKTRRSRPELHAWLRAFIPVFLTFFGGLLAYDRSMTRMGERVGYLSERLGKVEALQQATAAALGDVYVDVRAMSEWVEEQKQRAKRSVVKIPALHERYEPPAQLYYSP